MEPLRCAVRPRTRVGALIIGLALLAPLLSIGCSGSPPPTGATIGTTIEIIDVVDGDTVEIRVGGRTETVRLLGIDAPETVHPTLPEQCFGREASAELAEVLPPGTAVDVYRDVQLRDHFGRLLLYIYRADDDLDVNLHLVENGMAATSFYEPNVGRRAALATAERRARSDGTGLWGRCDGPDQPLQ